MKRREKMVDRMLISLVRNRKTALLLAVAGIVAIGAGLLLVAML